LAKKHKKRVRKKTKKKKSFFEKNKIPILAGIIIIAIIGIALGFKSTAKQSANVEIDLYVMSQCPYGVQAENALAPVIDKFGTDIINIHYISRETETGFQSLHGEPETKGNIVQLCAAKYEPKKYYNFITCQNLAPQNIPDNWEQCAEQVGLNKEKIRTCYEGDEGKQLLSESIKKTEAAGATASPTIYLNGEPYQGARTSTDFARAVCQEIEYKHPGCDDVPKPVELKGYIINDERCGEACNPARIQQVIQQLFPGLTFEEKDASEAGDMIQELGILRAPTFVLEDKVTETNTWKTNDQIRNAFKQSGEYYMLKDEATQASWFISDEARANYEKLLEEKQKKVQESLGIEEGIPQVDFFVMSYCPYGNQAEELLLPVYEKLKDKAKFVPHYVIYSNYQGGGPQYCLDDQSEYCSMHGIQELNQGIREVCVYKELGTKEWFDFAIKMNSECTAANADTCWQAVAESLDLDTAQIQTCLEQQGLKIADDELWLNRLLGVRGSPTLFINGKQYGGARTSNAYLAALCAEFDEMPTECTGVIQEQAQQAPAAGACG
jgi:predicted DsbA family dithiol-disulfide isomerase